MRLVPSSFFELRRDRSVTLLLEIATSAPVHRPPRNDNRWTWNLKRGIWNPTLRSRSNTAMKKPEILAPVNAIEEVQPLLEVGADWLYGGCLPRQWSEKYPSIIPLNQRTFSSAQITSLEDLTTVVSLTNELGGRFALTLNAPFYMDEQYPPALELACLAKDLGVSALIVADPGMVRRIRREGIDIAIHLSTMAVASNSSAVDLFRSMGVERIVLPRFLDLKEIQSLCSGAPEVDFEVFILVGRCPNIEGMCSFLHDSPNGRWPCEWAYSVTCADGSAPPDGIGAAIDGVRSADRRNGCGLCALPALIRAGVSTFKIVGRGTSQQRKAA
ncbi:U32 family peptidase, partial [bacterium]